MNKSIKQIKYGLSLQKSIDVTEIFLNLIRKSHTKSIDLSRIPVHKIFTDPYPNKRKLFIFINLDGKETPMASGYKSIYCWRTNLILDKNKYLKLESGSTIFSSKSATPATRFANTSAMVAITATPVVTATASTSLTFPADIKDSTTTTSAINTTATASPKEFTDASAMSSVNELVSLVPSSSSASHQVEAGDGSISSSSSFMEPNTPASSSNVLSAVNTTSNSSPEQNLLVTAARNMGPFKSIQNSKRVFIITRDTGGGAAKYLNDIISHYHFNSQFIVIGRLKGLLKVRFRSTDIIFVQHLIRTRITLDILINIKERYKPRMIVSLHDFYWFYEGNPQNSPNIIGDRIHDAYLNDEMIIDPKVRTLFSLCEYIICPTKFVMDEYLRRSLFKDLENFILIPHNDIIINAESHKVPTIINNVINIGMMQIPSRCKGSEYILFLKSLYQNRKYKGYIIRFLVIEDPLPRYQINDFYKVLNDNNIHSLLHLNKYGETYSYCLSYSLNSGLPILYNNIGAYRERIPRKEHYFKVFERENENNLEYLKQRFREMLDYIIENQGKYDNVFPNIDIKYAAFYDWLFRNGPKIK